MSSNWSGWKQFYSADWKKIPKASGIYQIRCRDKSGKIIAIDRLKGKDREGILAIGESKDLRRRLKQFWHTVDIADFTRHAAAWHYLSFGYEKIFPKEHLEFRFRTTKDKDKAIEIEFEMLLEYRKKFRDGPPLNVNRGRYPDDYKERIRKLFGWYFPKGE